MKHAKSAHKQTFTQMHMYMHASMHMLTDTSDTINYRAIYIMWKAVVYQQNTAHFSSIAVAKYNYYQRFIYTDSFLQIYKAEKERLK